MNKPIANTYLSDSPSFEIELMGLLNAIESLGRADSSLPPKLRDFLREYKAFDIHLCNEKMAELWEKVGNNLLPTMGLDAFMGLPVQANPILRPGEMLLVERPRDRFAVPRMVRIVNVKEAE